MQTKTNKFQVILSILKDLTVILRDGIILILFLLLIITPGRINSILVSAGFTKGTIGGLSWEAKLKTTADETRTVGQSVDLARRNYDSLADRLKALELKMKDPRLKSEVKQITDMVTVSQDELATADRTVKRSLASQQQIVAEIAPSQSSVSGWLYLGKVNQDKSNWELGSPVTVASFALPFRVDRILNVTDDAYLRAEGSTVAHASASIVGVVKAGAEVRAESFDFSPVPGGGWFVWARVKVQ